jgi:hypothetical protein
MKVSNANMIPHMVKDVAFGRVVTAKNWKDLFRLVRELMMNCWKIAPLVMTVVESYSVGAGSVKMTRARVTAAVLNLRKSHYEKKC